METAIDVKKERQYQLARYLLGFAPFAKNCLPDEPVIPFSQAIEVIVSLIEKIECAVGYQKETT